MRKSSRRLLWLVTAQMPAPSTRDAYEHISAVDCQMSRGHGWGKLRSDCGHEPGGSRKGCTAADPVVGSGSVPPEDLVLPRVRGRAGTLPHGAGGSLLSR